MTIGVAERSREVMAVMVLHETLRNVCLNSDWNYAVFWTIRPRPRSRGGMAGKVGEEGSLMLMWEDGFCQSMACASSVDHMDTPSEDPEAVVRASSTSHFAEDGEEEDPIKRAFRKMSIQLYNYGEGLMGKVASDKCHKWVFREASDSEVAPLNYWQSSFDSHPPEWTDQFSAGIQTIAVIQAGHGLLQLGSCKIIAEDLHFVLRMRYTFESVESQSGFFLSQSFAPMRNRFFTASPTASPSIWPQNHASLLQGSDCKLRLGFSSEASNQDLLLQGKIPKQTEVNPSTSAHKSPGGYNKIKSSEDAVDSSPRASPNTKRLSGTLMSERPPPFLRDRFSQGVFLSESGPGSPNHHTQSTQNLLEETPLVTNFPISLMLSPSTKASAAYETFHVQLPEASDTATGNLQISGAAASRPWPVSSSMNFENNPQQEQEKLGFSNVSMPPLPVESKSSSNSFCLIPSNHQNIEMNSSHCKKESLERPQFSDMRIPDWTSAAHPTGDVMEPVWGNLKVPHLESLDCQGLSLQTNDHCGSGDIYSFMESLFE